MEPRSNSGGCGGDSMRAGQSPAVAVKRRRRRRRRRQRSSPASRRTKPLSIIPPDNLLERWSDINQVCPRVFVVWRFEVVLFWTLCRLKGVTSNHLNELADIEIIRRHHFHGKRQIPLSTACSHSDISRGCLQTSVAPALRDGRLWWIVCSIYRV